MPGDNYPSDVHEAMKENVLSREYREMRIEELLEERCREKRRNAECIKQEKLKVKRDKETMLLKPGLDLELISPSVEEQNSADRPTGDRGDEMEEVSCDLDALVADVKQRKNQCRAFLQKLRDHIRYCCEMEGAVQEKLSELDEAYESAVSSFIQRS